MKKVRKANYSAVDAFGLVTLVRMISKVTFLHLRWDSLDLPFSQQHSYVKPALH